jgi:hypothetical protein
VHLAVERLLPRRRGEGIVGARQGPAAGEQVEERADRPRVDRDKDPGDACTQLVTPLKIESRTTKTTLPAVSANQTIMAPSSMGSLRRVLTLLFALR